MAAYPTVPQFQLSRQHPISRSGVLTLSGFGIKVRVQRGHLETDDGVGMERRKIRLPRVGHGLKRLVCISGDGFTTLSALKWLADVGASFVMLNRNGKVLFVTRPTAPSDARLRRSQCLALSNGVGVEICRRLIDSLIERREDPSDRRRHSVRLTQAGLRKTVELRPMGEQTEQEMLKGLSASEKHSLHKMLVKLFKTMAL